MKEQQAPKPAHGWTFFLVILGTLFIGVTAWSILQAKQRVSGVIDRDYYSHGLRYNETELERPAAKSLGWRLSTSFDHPSLEARLVDAGNQPISGCNAEARLQLPDGTARLLPTSETSPGCYCFDLPDELRGEVLVQLSLRRDQASFHHRLLINLPEA